MPKDDSRLCAWVGQDPVMIRYHDEEWGVPVHDDQKWFEFIVLDAFQAGLSWKTVLHKRAAFHQVFHGFDPERVAGMTEVELEEARHNPAIIRNQRKIRSAVDNAGAFCEIQDEWGSFDVFIWSFTSGQTVHNSWRKPGQVPATTPLSDTVSRTLKSRGFSFVGSTICYAFLQAGGVVNDHLLDCFRYRELAP